MALMIEMYSLRVGPRQDATRENTYEKDQRVILWHTAPKLHKRNPAITFIRARSYNILFGYRFGNPKVGYVGCVKWKMKDDNLWDLRTKWNFFTLPRRNNFLTGYQKFTCAHIRLFWLLPLTMDILALAWAEGLGKFIDKVLPSGYFWESPIQTLFPLSKLVMLSGFHIFSTSHTSYLCPPTSRSFSK